MMGQGDSILSTIWSVRPTVKDKDIKYDVSHLPKEALIALTKAIQREVEVRK